MHCVRVVRREIWGQSVLNTVIGPMQMNQPKAYIFDVFGTLTNWRTAISREVATQSGNRGYVPLDDIHSENLSVTLKAFNINPLEENRHTQLARAWERLDIWEDVQSGLNALKKKAIIAPCSNGSIALMTHLARRTMMIWPPQKNLVCKQRLFPDT